jgi:dipeptidyl aminopeptidase/acylaminoacyl peptidase
MIKHIILTFSLTFLAIHAGAQDYPNQSSLKLEEIMKGNSFIGHQPSNIRWTMDGNKILFDWNPYDQPGSSTYAYDVKTGVTDSVTADFYKKNAPYSDVKNSSCALYTLRGDLYRYDLKSRMVKPILVNSDRIYDLQYSIGNNRFYFRMGSGFYEYNDINRGIKEIVRFKKGPAPSEKELNYMETEELELFEYHQENKERKEWNEEFNIFKSNDIPTIYYNESSVSNVQISGMGGFITYSVNDYPKNNDTHVENHISKDGHTYTSNARAKVSDKDPNHKLGIYDMMNDTSYFVDFSNLPDIRKKPDYLKDYGDSTALYEKDRNIIMHKLIYSENGKRNVLDIRSYDNKDRWIVSVSLKNGAIRVIDHQHDEAWIGGPGISSWNMVSGTLGWTQDNNSIYLQSEETGYSHLYTIDYESREKTQRTKGNFEVHNVEYMNGVFFLTMNKTHPGDRGFYWLDKKFKLTPVMTKEGNHEVIISPDCTKLAYRYSNKNTPWELYWSNNGTNAKHNRITNSQSEAFKSYKWYAPSVVTFKDENKQDVHARLYKPEKANGAAIVFVHGAGYLQNAHNFWSGYYREYMFHNMLRDNGYTIIDIDYRASKGYGRDHRTAIYRHMGGADLEDQILGRQYLIDSCGIDPERIGIYGGSYGGFITLMALLNHPGKFQAGAALRSVTDWFHYNHEYTSNILNYPSSDPEAYKKSSPIYYADNLEDRLIMLHGMVDDNVQFQDVVRLSQRFIELGKTNWELAVFPVEPHGFKKASSWTDEYRRIYNLFYEELIQE